MPEILELLASPVHRFGGRPSDGAAPPPPGELVTSARIRTGLGIVGDRYFGHPAHRDASVTVIAQEGLQQATQDASPPRSALAVGSQTNRRGDAARIRSGSDWRPISDRESPCPAASSASTSPCDEPSRREP